MPDIGVIYLYRFADGEGPVRAFLESYRAHPAGVTHDLYVIFKGFPDLQSLTSGKALFASLPIIDIELDDSGYDIGSYFRTAKLVSNQRLIFFNTFTELLVDNWLEKFDAALSLRGVGLVGATGSWQSHCSGYEAIAKQVCYRLRHPKEYFRELLEDLRCTQKSADATVYASVEAANRPQVRRQVGQIARALYHLIRLDRYVLYRFGYHRYPNPHIRTNAFMVERQRFLELRVPPFSRKSDAYKFESGRRSLTRQVMAQNLRPVVVDRTGNTYDVTEWKSSMTYWIDQQINLIASDNRTREYAEGSPEFRTRLEDNAWMHPSSWAVRGRRISSPKG